MIRKILNSRQQYINVRWNVDDYLTISNNEGYRIYVYTLLFIGCPIFYIYINGFFIYWKEHVLFLITHKLHKDKIIVCFFAYLAGNNCNNWLILTRLQYAFKVQNSNLCFKVVSGSGIRYTSKLLRCYYLLLIKHK